MKELSYDLIKYYYEVGSYDLLDVIECVEDEQITEEQFHFITGYNYRGLLRGQDFNIL